MNKIIIIGGGSHAESIIEICKNVNISNKIIGYTDISKTKISLPYLGTDDQIINFDKKKISLINGIGINIKLRKKVFEKFYNNKFDFIKFNKMKNSYISPVSKIGVSSIIFPNAVIGPKVIIGNNVVVHSGAIIEHDTIIGDNCYIAPGAIICGNCKIGDNCLIGANSTIIENITLKQNSVLGAHSLLNKNFKMSRIYKGIPAS